MNAKDVKLGNVYLVKVSDKLTKVRIHSKSKYGGWDGMNLETKRQVRIKTAARLRCLLEGEPAAKPKTKTPSVVVAEPEAVVATTLRAVPEPVIVAATQRVVVLQPAAVTEVKPQPQPRNKLAGKDYDTTDWHAAGERWMAGESQRAIAESLGVKVSTLDRQITKLGYTKAAKLALGYKRAPYRNGGAALVPSA